MSKFQRPMFNDDVFRPPTDKQTHTHIHKHTYRVKTEETFFYGQFFYFLFFFLYLFESKKDGFQYKLHKTITLQLLDTRSFQSTHLHSTTINLCSLLLYYGLSWPKVD